jgi:cytochrome bd-type quinol oxidase subunit 2
MNDNYITYIEYAVLPLILVLVTFFLKNLTKDNSRTELKEYFTMGFDIILVCIFGIAIFGLGIYNHNKDLESIKFVVKALIFSLILLALSIILTFIIKKKGDDSKVSFVLQVLFAFIAIYMLVYFINTGNNSAHHLQIPKKDNNQTNNKDSIRE